MVRLCRRRLGWFPTKARYIFGSLTLVARSHFRFDKALVDSVVLLSDDANVLRPPTLYPNANVGL